MAFRAQKLRVQLPCSAEGSVVDLAAGDEREALRPDGPIAASCMVTMLDYCHCSVMPPVHYPPATCIDSAMDSRPVVMAIEQRPLLVEPEALPLLKKQLENRLAEMELAIEVVRARTTARLAEIAAAEQVLSERRDQQPDA